MSKPENTAPETELTQRIRQEIAAAGGWIGFDRFMEMALYTPQLGYYANPRRKFGAMPGSGSDFITAPEMSPLFGQTLAVQIRQALDVTGTNGIWEFGAGSGALALQLMQALGDAVQHYHIVDVSATLRQRQQETLHALADRVTWHDTLPAHFDGIVIGNEVLDAMPVQLLVRTDDVWNERGVVEHGGQLAWGDSPTTLRPPLDIPAGMDYLTEIHPRAEAFVRTIAACLNKGAVFFVDYGFGEREYYHEQRNMGTLMCHKAHQADANPLVDIGQKDITTHVNFTGIALAAQNAGMSVLGYTSQARLLLNCGLAEAMSAATLRERNMAMRLVMEHEMGELFKVIALGAGDATWEPAGFATGDRTHRL